VEINFEVVEEMKPDVGQVVEKSEAEVMRNKLK